MQKSSFFNSVNGDRKYKAEEWAAYFASFIGNGIFPDPSTNLMVQANADMTVTVKAGKAWINGYFYMNSDDLIVQLDNADGVLKRIDRIVVRWSLTNRSIVIAVKKGTLASSPVAKALQRDADVYELALADVLVNNGVIQITQGNITDLRQNSSLCGLVTGVIDQIDASGLFAQYQQIFYDWFATLEDVLDENTAANLLNLINVHKADYVAQPANGGTTGGTATAYTCTSNPAPTTLIDKIGVVITAHTDSGTNPTLNWNTLGAKAIKKPNGNAAVLKSGGVYTLRYNATSQNFILQGEGASGNATASDLLSGKTASTDAGDIVGTMANRGAVNITPSTANQAIQAGYHNGSGLVQGSANLIADNIKDGVNIFGVVGNLVQGKKFASGTTTLSVGTTSFTTPALGFTPTAGLCISNVVGVVFVFNAGVKNDFAVKGYSETDWFSSGRTNRDSPFFNTNNVTFYFRNDQAAQTFILKWWVWE